MPVGNTESEAVVRYTPRLAYELLAC